MGYSADDFFDDVVKKATTIEDIFNIPTDSRGLPKFLKYLIYLYGDNSFERGLYELIEDPCFLMFEAEGGRKMFGYLPEDCELVIKPLKD